MTCAPEKSEFIRIRAKYARRENRPSFELFLDGGHVGLWIQQTAGVAHTLRLLKGTAQNVAKMIRRVTRTREGFSEEEMIQLVHAFVTSRITYALPFQSITKQELKQLEVIIRRAFKAALGLPANTITERFEKCGIHNTFEEYATATLIVQKKRLCASTQGRAILIKLGFALRPQFSAEETVQMTQEVSQHIMMFPIPKYMNPTYHAARRKARARTLHQRFRGQPDVYYTDASQTSRDMYTVVATNQNLVIAASVRAKTANTAEAAVISLAIRHAENRDVSVAILTNSQTACRLYLTGTAPRLVLKILGTQIIRFRNLTWCPAHEGMEGNTRADRLACARSIRAADRPSD